MININGVEFDLHPDIGFTKREPKSINYAHDYFLMMEDVKNKRYAMLLFGKEIEEVTFEEGTIIRQVKEKEKLDPGSLETLILRDLILNDLWFIVNFILKVPMSNRPFIVAACQEVENGPDGWTLDLWARVHYKSTIRKARNIQRLLKYPKKCQMIASHTRPAAKDHLRPIMAVLETSEILHRCFPDVLYNDPKRQSPKWSEDDGLIEKGHEPARNESTLVAAGLIEGMPTGHHYDYIDIDDVETRDNVKSPEVIANLRGAIDYGLFLLSEGGSISIWGTPYSHMGAYIPYIRDAMKADGNPRYLYRNKPATDNGLRMGKPVLMTGKELMDLFAVLDREEGRYAADSQLLINPTPHGTERLNPDYLQRIERQFIPKTVYRFMIIDQAGDDPSNKSKAGDSWAIAVFGVEPVSDEIGQSKVFIEQLWVEPAGESEAIDQAVRMYIAGGIIKRIGVEKVGISTTHLHISRALRARGRYVEFTDDKISAGVLLRPAGRTKKKFIEGAVAWPLNNSKLFYSSEIPNCYIDRLKMEMNNFPLWHDDALNTIAYLYDVAKDYSFTRSEAEDPFTRYKRQANEDRYFPVGVLS